MIDVLVKNGQQIEKETPLITLETEKAAMDVPAPAAGRIAEVKVKKGDKVSEGSLILLLEGAAQGAAAPDKPRLGRTRRFPAARPAKTEGAAPAAAKRGTSEESPAEKPANGSATDPARPQAAAPQGSARPRTAEDAKPASAAPPPRRARAAPIDEKAFSTAYASPSVRKFARELGADLGQVKGTGPKGRITHEDVKAYVKKLLIAPPPAAAGGLPEGTGSRLREIRCGRDPAAVAHSDASPARACRRAGSTCRM